MDGLLTQVDDRVAVITLNRPQKMNAMTRPMNVRYVEALRDFNADPEVRVIVVTGAGSAFCAGADLSNLSSDDYHREVTNAPGPSPTVATELDKPVVAAVNGAVAGLGFALMLSCDVRFIAAEARLTTSFARLGMPADYGIAWMLPRIVGSTRAAEILYSGRPILAPEAVQIGIATESVSDGGVLDRALAWASDVARNCAPYSLAAIKDQLRQGATETLEDSIARAVARMQEAFTQPHLAEGLAAQRERREPRFSGLGRAE